MVFLVSVSLLCVASYYDALHYQCGQWEFKSNSCRLPLRPHVGTDLWIVVGFKRGMLITMLAAGKQHMYNVHLAFCFHAMSLFGVLLFLVFIQDNAIHSHRVMS